jgi:hypothetical protein
MLHEKDRHLAQWFSGLDAFLRRATKHADLLRWDRLIASGANLRALILELKGDRLLGVPKEFVNLDQLCHTEVREQLLKELGTI